MMISLESFGYDPKDIVSISIDRPIWTLGYEDANWLLPKKEKDCNHFVILNFSVEMKGVPEEGDEQKEDDIGRLTRSLPLYLGERINLEKMAKATNINLLLKGIVSGLDLIHKALNTK